MSEQKNIPNQTFDNFIVSRSNKKAYSACLDLANNPQGKFVVIYGANSLGKTDLLIVDNMQFVAGKNCTQEDIANWVNKMDTHGKNCSYVV